MAEYPSSPRPIDPVTITPIWKTIVTDSDSSKEQRRQKWSFPKYDIQIRYRTITPRSSMQTLWAFYMARTGAAEAFSYYPRYTGDHKSQYIGYGDGATTIFDLPGKSTSSQAIYLDDVAQGGGDYSILTGGGGESSDRVEFVAAPSSGELITCDFTGYLRIRCRFAEDKMSEDHFFIVCYRTGIKLKGLSFEI